MYIENQSKLSEVELFAEVWKILEESGNDVTVFYTGPCFHCFKQGCVFVRESDYNSWIDGKLIQEAFPEMPAERREQMVNGIHPECWNELFPKEEE